MPEAGKTREQLLRNLDKAMGISQDEMRSLRNSFGAGMKQGTVSFAPSSGEDGVFGQVRYQTKGGAEESRPITNPAEAAYLAGLQNEIKKKR